MPHAGNVVGGVYDVEQLDRYLESSNCSTQTRELEGQRVVIVDFELGVAHLHAQG